MRPLRWPSLIFRILVWCGTAYGANYVTATGRGDITGPVDTRTALFGPHVIYGTAFFLVLTVLPGLLYVLLIRTWAGSVLVGAAFAALVIASMRSIANSMSSTAGAGILGVPAIPLVAIAVGLCVEAATSKVAPTPPPPPPDGKRLFIVAYNSRSGGLWGAMRARSEYELTARWPELLVVRDRPAGLSDEHLAYLYDHELHDIDDSPWGILDVVAAERQSP